MSNKRSIKIVTLLALRFMLAGCSFLPDCFNDYRESVSMPPLNLPAGMCCAQLGDDLAIPETCDSAASINLLPPDSLVLDVAQGKLTKKELKKRERSSRITRVTWTQNQWGMRAIMTSEALPAAWKHLERALQKLAAFYPIIGKDEGLATFYIYDLPAAHGRKSSNTPVYQLRLLEYENGSIIVLAEDNADAPPSERVNKRIAGALYEALDETKEGLSLKQWLFS
jgi:uncharacterized lipoprotein